ncbi:MAG: undecaprenyldiphospho-muramoylpentapeptide beta-N-acetylglucosaminyltransferase [Pseudomonadota bacterium]
MMNKKFKLIIAGGKTGGHLFPGIAIAQALERMSENAKILFVGTDAPFETNTLQAYGYAHKAIYSKPIKGGSLWGKLISVSIVLISLTQSLIIMKTIKPDFVIGVGGFSSFAVVLAAWLLNIPTAIQEQNAVPGMTNRMLARFARTIFTSFEHTQGFSNNPKVHYVGNPVRKIKLSDADKDSTDLDIHPDRFTLLITGGSQGASSINTAMMNAFELMDNPNRFNIIHQTGIKEEAQIQKRYKQLNIKATAKAFFHDMPNIQKMADLIITRAGAGILSELCIHGKPAILIPFPHAADDHQTVNAKTLEEQGAAVMINDAQLTGSSVKAMIENLMQDRSRLEKMGKAIKALAMPDADKTIATHILQTKDGRA